MLIAFLAFQNFVRCSKVLCDNYVPSFQVLDAAFYLPYRSIHYAANLRKIDFSYSDQVSDIHLGEIVTVCRGTLEINDYYSLPVKPIYDI